MKLMPWKKSSTVDKSSDHHDAPTPAAKEEHPAPVTVDDGSKKAIAELQKNFADLTAQYKNLKEENVALHKNVKIADDNTKKFVDETKKEAHHEDKKAKKNVELSEEDTHSIIEKAKKIQASLRGIVPKDYAIDIEPTASGSQRVVIKRPGITQKAVKSEFYVTVRSSNTVMIDYSPYDHYDTFHYTGEFNLSDTEKITDCVKAVVVAMQAQK